MQGGLGALARARPDESASDLGATCDPDGRFAFANVKAGVLALFASDDQHVATRIDGAELEALGSEVEIVLASVGVLDVEVVDEAGEPLRDVLVSVTAAPLDASAGHLDRFEPGQGFGPSDAQGRILIERAPCGVELHVGPWSPRTAAPTKTSTTKIDLPARRALVRLVLERTGALTGIVRPVPAGADRTEARFRSATPAMPVARSVMTIVQPDGRFTLERLTAGRGVLDFAVIRLGARATTQIGAEREVEVLPGELTDLGLLDRK